MWAFINVKCKMTGWLYWLFNYEQPACFENQRLKSLFLSGLNHGPVGLPSLSSKEFLLMTTM